MRRLALVWLALLLTARVYGQVTMTLSKSGGDVVLTWAGGAGPYTVTRATHPNMLVDRTTLTTLGTSPYTDVAPPANSYYIVSDAGAPSVTVVTPSAGFASPAPCICAAGTASETLKRVYANGAAGTVAGATWEVCPHGTGVPLAITKPGAWPPCNVTVICVDLDDNYTWGVVQGSYVGAPTMPVCTPRPMGY